MWALFFDSDFTFILNSVICHKSINSMRLEKQARRGKSYSSLSLVAWKCKYDNSVFSLSYKGSCSPHFPMYRKSLNNAVFETRENPRYSKPRYSNTTVIFDLKIALFKDYQGVIQGIDKI